MDDGAKSGFELAFFDVDPLWHCCLCWFTQALYVSKACDKKTPDLNRKKRFFKDKKKKSCFLHIVLILKSFLKNMFYGYNSQNF